MLSKAGEVQKKLILYLHSLKSDGIEMKNSCCYICESEKNSYEAKLKMYLFRKGNFASPQCFEVSLMWRLVFFFLVSVSAFNFLVDSLCRVKVQMQSRHSVSGGNLWKLLECPYVLEMGIYSHIHIMKFCFFPCSIQLGYTAEFWHASIDEGAWSYHW